MITHEQRYRYWARIVAANMHVDRDLFLERLAKKHPIRWREVLEERAARTHGAANRRKLFELRDALGLKCGEGLTK